MRFPVPGQLCFNLAAASWPPGRGRCLASAWTSWSFNLAAASWPPGRPVDFQSFNLAAASAAGTRHGLRASIWRRPLGRRDSSQWHSGCFNLAAASWPPGHHRGLDDGQRSFNLAAASWPPGLATVGDHMAAGTRSASGFNLAAASWPPGRPKRSRRSWPGPQRVLQSGGGLLAAGTRPGLRMAMRAEMLLQSGGGLLAAGTRPERGARHRKRTRSCFNLAAASWPPGHPHRRRGHVRSPLKSLQSGGGLLAAGTGAGDGASRSQDLLQSGGGLLAAGTGPSVSDCA